MLGVVSIKENITMVCVTAQFSCERLIREGSKIANQTNTKLYVVNVQQKDAWGNKFSKELEHLFTVSKNFNAEMLTFFSDHPIEIINDCIRRSHVKYIILGEKGKQSINIAEQLELDINETSLYII
jgi:K+-sensing histidine kinase KdpD